MFPRAFLLALLAFASATEDIKNSKRSISSIDYPSWNYILGNPWTFHRPWQSHPLGHDSHLFSAAYLEKSTHLPLEVYTTHDVAAAVAAAKEATAAAALAHQRVQAAREQVLIQERVAAAKEAAAQAAIQRSEAAAQVAAAIQKSKALAAAAAVANKSAAASAASAAAAHAAGHFTSAPWTVSKPAYYHWG